jgi:hypothetical protein
VNITTLGPFVSAAQALPRRTQRQTQAQALRLKGSAASILAKTDRLPGFMVVEVQVRVDAIDRRNHTVTFTDPHGVSHTAELHNPAMIRFAKLRVGNNVQIDYLQSISITMHPIPS